MKKIIIILSLCFILSGCDYQSRSDFKAEINKEKNISNGMDFPKITYVKDDFTEEDEDENNSDEDKINFKEIYGKGSLGENLDAKNSMGNLIDTKIDDTQIGISLLESVQSPGGYSTFISYKKDGNLVEREFGPLAGFNDLASTVSYDMIDSQSGKLLLISQVSVFDGNSFSAYYLFNKYMGLMDYLVFRTSTDNVDTTVERLGEVIEYPDSPRQGSLEEAINNRIATEDEYLKTLLDVYGVKTKAVSSYVEGKKMEIGYIADIEEKNRILHANTSSNPMNIDLK